MHDASNVKNQGTSYRTEHALAWLLATISIILGVLGALEAFDMLSLGDSNLATSATLEPRGDANIFADGLLLLVPALIAAALAFSFHRNEHHELGGDTGRASGNEPTIGDGLAAEDDFFKGEHVIAYVTGILTVALVAVGILTGFRVFDEEHTFYDGMTWLVLAGGTALLSNTFHSVGHHLPSRAPRYVTTTERAGDLPGGRPTGRPSISPR